MDSIRNHGTQAGFVAVSGNNNGTINNHAEVVKPTRPPDLNLRLARRWGSPRKSWLAGFSIISGLASISSLLLTVPGNLPIRFDASSDLPSSNLAFTAGILFFVFGLCVAAFFFALWRQAQLESIGQTKRTIGWKDRVFWFKLAGTCPIDGGRLRCYGKPIDFRPQTSAITGEDIDKPVKWTFVAECERDDSHAFPLSVADARKAFADQSQG